MNRITRPLAVAAAGLMATALPIWVTAQGMDPTRPPFAMPTSSVRAAAGTAPNTAAAGTVSTPAAAPGAEGKPAPAKRAALAEHRLTSVMWGGPNGAAAVIDGEVVRVGEKVRGATVVSIDRQGVTLKGGAGAGRLMLFSRPADPAPLSPSEGASAPGKDTP